MVWSWVYSKWEENSEEAKNEKRKGRKQCVIPPRWWSEYRWMTLSADKRSHQTYILRVTKQTPQLALHTDIWSLVWVLTVTFTTCICFYLPALRHATTGPRLRVLCHFAEFTHPLGLPWQRQVQKTSFLGLLANWQHEIISKSNTGIESIGVRDHCVERLIKTHFGVSFLHILEL